MKKSSFVLNTLVAASIITGSAGIGHAGDLKINAFADILYIGMNDQPSLDPTNGKNLVEGQFVAKGEINLEKENGGVTFRMDLDFPSSETGPADNDGAANNGGSLGNTLASTNMSVNGLPGGPNTFAEHIEQAKFVWDIPGLPIDPDLTGGVFNSPIGYESQDAPDRSFVSYGQLFGLVPSNLAGVMLEAEHGPFSGSVLFTDDWAGTAAGPVGTTGFVLPASEENSFGLTFGYSDANNSLPDLSVGYITTSAALDATLDIIISGSVMPSSDLDLSYAVEYLTDDVVDTAFAVTLGATHGKHALHVRYDSVDPAAGAATPTSLTLSASCALADTLTARVEYVTFDADGGADAFGTANADSDMLLIQFVATLM